MRILLYSIATLAILQTAAQTAPPIEWQHAFGGSAAEQVKDILQTADGGFVFAGNTFSTNGDVVFNHGLSDCWVVKLDAQGNMIWKRTYGGSGDDIASAIEQTADGGYIVAGATISQDGDVTGNHGDNDAWVIRLNSFGDLLWQLALGGSDADGASSIAITDDEGYIVAGFSYSNDGDVLGNQGSADYWVVKLDATGAIDWQRTLGGSGYDEATQVQQTHDGGYIITGGSGSTDGDVDNSHGSGDEWVVKLDSGGNMEWQRSLGGAGDEVGYAIQQTADGSYITAGYTFSNDGDVSGYHGNGDAWVAKLSSNGALEWQQCLGGSNFEMARSIDQTADGGFIVFGQTQSSDGQVSGNHGGQLGDYWAVRLDSAGTLLWQRCLGGSNSDLGIAVLQASDQGYVLAGSSKSTDGDVTGSHGGYDAWIVKLGADDVGVTELEMGTAFTLYPNPATDAVTIRFDRTSSAPLQLKLFDAAGRSLRPELKGISVMGESDVQIALGTLPAGLYELRINTGDRWYARRLVKL